jgi:hypothetical protein
MTTDARPPIPLEAIPKFESLLDLDPDQALRDADRHIATLACSGAETKTDTGGLVVQLFRATAAIAHSDAGALRRREAHKLGTWLSTDRDFVSRTVGKQLFTDQTLTPETRAGFMRRNALWDLADTAARGRLGRDKPLKTAILDAAWDLVRNDTSELVRNVGAPADCLVLLCDLPLPNATRALRDWADRNFAARNRAAAYNSDGDIVQESNSIVRHMTVDHRLQALVHAQEIHSANFRLGAAFKNIPARGPEYSDIHGALAADAATLARIDLYADATARRAGISESPYPGADGPSLRRIVARPFILGDAFDPADISDARACDALLTVFREGVVASPARAPPRRPGAPATA